MFAGFKPIKPLLHVEADRLSDEERYWNRLKEVSVFQEAGNITCTDFLPVDPYFVASTCSNRLTVIDTNACEPLAIFSRIKSPLHCVAFRSDGHLAGVGTQDGQVHFFDVVRLRKKRGIKHPIRSFNNAHKHRISSITYSASNLNFASMADDGNIKLWDLTDSRGADATPIWCVEGAHSDHIRSGVFSAYNDHLLVTGSYDHTVKVWDARMKDSNTSAILEMNHGKPVEKILLFPNENVVASAGGTSIKLWDIASGGKLLHTMENHFKTVTSMCFATNKTYLLSGGLDRRINLFRCNSGDFALIKSWKVAAQVLSLSMSPDDQVMAYGMSNLLSIHHRKSENELNDTKKGDTNNNNNGFDFLGEKSRKKRRSTSEAPLFIDTNVLEPKRRVAAPAVIQRERTAKAGFSEAIMVELTARHLDKMNLGVMDNLLRQRRYREFFATAVSKCATNAELAVAALQQLRIRQKLYTAIAGHPERVLLSFTKFLKANLFKGSFFDILYDVINVFFTVYADERLPETVVAEIDSLTNDVLSEIHVQKELSKVLGKVSMLIFKSADQMIRNAEESASKTKIERDSTENGSIASLSSQGVVIVNEENAKETSVKVEWRL